uniref:Uncharacterized protein n=1 Tax=Oryza barthii TaxID=65489 RepID=A0A0D3F4Y6_9ORYZ
MVVPVLLLVRLDTAAVDPTMVANLRDLIGSLNGKTFYLACDSQIVTAAAGDNDPGMFVTSAHSRPCSLASLTRSRPPSTPWRSSSARLSRRWQHTSTM